MGTSNLAQRLKVVQSLNQWLGRLGNFTCVRDLCYLTTDPPVCLTPIFKHVLMLYSFLQQGVILLGWLVIFLKK